MHVNFYSKDSDGNSIVEFSLDIAAKDLTNILLLDSILNDDIIYKITHKSFDTKDKIYFIIVEKTKF